MSRMLRFSSGFLLLVLLLSGCNKDFVNFYKRPDNLAQPIYQQLVARKNFTSLIACIDKAGYKDILGKAGYWTFFAPNDAAFAKYFTDNGITGVSAIDSVTAKKLIQFSLVYNSYRKDQLTNYQSSKGVIPYLAYKKKTTFYDFVQTETVQPRKFVGSNRNGTYTAGDNDNKSLPFFTDNFLTANGLTGTDYSAFFPDVPYTGFNVVDASVVNADINAENGMIHEIDKVLVPMLSIDQYLSSNPNYSEFRKLLNTMISFSYNTDLTHRYNVLSGSTDSVFVKMYNGSLGFSPNNENYLLGTTDSQIGGYTLMVPTNQELLNYTKKLLTYFGTFDKAPPAVLMDYINSHMWTSPIWPVKFQHSSNFQGEEPTLTFGNVIEKKLLSNGILYGIDKEQDANVFRTVYSKPYLNPAYTMMLRVLDVETKYLIVNPNITYTMFMIPDVQAIAGGYRYTAANESNSTPWSYAAPGPPVGASSAGSTQRDNFYKIVKTSVSAANVNITPTQLAGNGVIETYNGEYLLYNNNTIVASGNVDAGNYIVKDSSQTAFNGTVYYTHEVLPTGAFTTGGLLTYSLKEVGLRLNQLAVNDPTNFASFNSYMINSATCWDPILFHIKGTSIGSFYTILVPTNAAIVLAVKAGVLPGTVATGVPNFNPTVATDIDLVTKFLQFHILNKNTVATDGAKYGSFLTLLVDSFGQGTYMKVANTLNSRVNNSLNSMVLTDMTGRSANVVIPKSNNLAAECLIHSIDNYLMYIY